MLDAAKKAEAVLTTGVLPQGVEFVADGPVAVVSSSAGAAGEDALAVVEEDVSVTEVSEIATPAEEVSRSASPAPSAATAADFTALLPEGTKLTAQTFLVRPTRPDANRNRGKKPFKRRPAGPAGPGAAAAAATTASASPSTPTPAPAARIPTPAPAAEEEDSSDSDDELVAEMEHLQLSYQEAWFLSSLGVLKVFDPEVASYIPPTALLQHLLTPISPPAPSPALVPARATALYPDDPLLVSYAAYHHYRSLGWCVRDGIKFCVDWLLYRRGPVFSHSV
jgi:tRNA-splicing endonuclease subunit Sen2